MNFWTFMMNWKFVALVLWFDTFTPSERVALAAAFLVLIGVIGEYAAELHSVEAKKWLKNLIKRFSMAILVLGLSGDVLGIVMGQAEMAALTKQAGDAATSANSAAYALQLADQRLTTIESKAGELDKRLNATGLQVDAVSQKADDASDRVSKLSGKLAEDEKAEVQLKRLLWMIDTKASDRALNGQFVEALKGKPVATAEIWFVPKDREAYMFAYAIRAALGRGGWSVSEPVLIPEGGGDVRYSNNLASDITILSSVDMSQESGTKTAAGALCDAFMNGRTGAIKEFSNVIYPGLAPDHFIIIVGQKSVPIGPLDDKLNSNTKRQTPAKNPH